MKKRTKALSLLLLLCMIISLLPTNLFVAYAEDAAITEKVDAMEAIKGDSALSAYMQGETQKYSDDGYIGIPYEITVYYDVQTHGASTPGYMTLGGTPVILYVVNADFERVGTDSDVSIIKSMLARGYAVVVVDYLNNGKAKSPALEWSTQLIRAKMDSGDFFLDKAIFASGTYQDTIVVPSGYNVKLNDVYFELDKHGVDGTLEKIVNVWNNDFRMYHKDKIVKWVRENGLRKETQVGFDGSAPVWYSDPTGNTVDLENGQYTKIYYTKAETITDCVRPDGEPIDLNLYMHIIYPTNPVKDVPLMMLYSSSEHMLSSVKKSDRPQLPGFLFNGYAGAIADYAYVPMCRKDVYGTFNGSDEGKSVTGDNMTYSTYIYNATQAATAALRYVRYLSLSDHDTYCFDEDKIGTWGISKSAWYTQVGAPALRNDLLTKEDGLSELEIAERVNDKINSFIQLLYPAWSNGETRYDKGYTDSYTKDGFTVDGGELQPWSVYNGNEISSGAQLVYSSCGAFVDYFCEDYSPLFITENLLDTSNTEYGQQNIMVNLCRTMNIPALWFEVNIEHTFAQGPDYNYGVDTYAAFYKFVDYYLSDAPVSVCYTNPVNGSVIRTTGNITVKFIGEVTDSEIQKVTITDGAGNTLTGTWTSAYGNTEWTFVADNMKGATAYTMTVPATLLGANGVAMGEEYTTTFYTRSEGEVTEIGGAVSLNTSGATFDLTVPEKTADGFKLRVNVRNNAANVLYAYNAANGALMGSVRVSGAGYHEIDVTDYLAAYSAGTKLSVTLKTAKSESLEMHFEKTFDSDGGGFNCLDSTTVVGAEIDGELALKITRLPRTNDGDHIRYLNMENSYTFSTNKLIKNGSAVTKEDLGRTFLITLRVYDTVSRPVRLFMNSATSRVNKQLDFDRVYYTLHTNANEWTEFTIPYTVYEMKYGVDSQVKDLYVQFTPYGGCDGNAIYLDNLKVEEVFTDIDASSISLVSIKDSGKGVKSPNGNKPFKVGSTEYATWKEAVNAAASGATVTMQSNYILTDADIVDISTKNNLTIDLDGYRLIADNTKNSPLWISATDASEITVTLKNGAVILGETPLASYESSTSAGTGKIVNVNIKDVYITVGKNSGTLSIVSAGSVSNATEVKVNFNFEDSVLDIERENLPDKTLDGLVILNSGDSALDVSYTFIGGKIIANGFHETVFCKSTINAEANADVEYLKVYIPTGITAPEVFFNKGNSYAILKSAAAENGYAVYNVEKAEYSTPYGFAPSTYENNTFVVFTNGVCVGGKDTWKDTLTLVRETLAENPGSSVQILMQKDREVTVYCQSYNWLCYMNGSVLLDMNGKTLTAKSTSLFELGADANYTGDYKTTLTVKNGRIIQSNGNVCGAQNASAKEKVFDVTFDNVTFKVDSEGNKSSLFYGQASNKANVDLALSFNDCTIDLTGIGSRTYTIFSFLSYRTYISADISYNGGAIKADSIDNVTFTTLDTDDDSFVLGKGSNDTYTTLTLPADYTMSKTFSAVTDDGKGVAFENGTVSGYYKVYTLAEKSLITRYGNIPESASDSAANPYVLFDSNRNYLGSATTWANAQKAAQTYLDANNGKTVYVLMRVSQTKGGWIASSGIMNGTVVLDLGGNTLYRENNSLIEANSNGLTEAQCNYTTNIIVKNGTILAGKKGSNNGVVVGIQTYGAYNKTYNITFEDVIFGVSKSNYDASKPIAVLIANDAGGTTAGRITANLTLRGCSVEIVDSDTMVVPTSMKLFHASKNNLSIVIEGGSFNGSMSVINFATLNSTSSLKFTKDDDGKYFEFNITDGAPLSGAVNTDQGLGYFVEGKTAGKYVIGIGRAKLTGASIKLGSSLSILYYVKIHDATLLSEGELSMTFTMNGKTVSVTAYELIDGEYVFSFNGIAPQQMADLVDAKFYVGEAEIASYSGYSVTKNCRTLLSKTADELGLSDAKYAAMKTLIADLLAYGKASQEYKEYYENGSIKVEGTTPSAATPQVTDKMVLVGNTNVSLHFASANARFDTVNSVIFKIYAASDDSALVVVRINGADYALSDLTSLGNGVYKLDTDGISAVNFDTIYTVELLYDGVSVATISYSVNAYAYAMCNGATQNSKMKALAGALYRYGVSAKAYANAQ